MNTNKKYQDPLLNKLTNPKREGAKYTRTRALLGSPFFNELMDAMQNNYCIQMGNMFYSVVGYEFNEKTDMLTFKMLINPFMQDS